MFALDADVDLLNDNPPPAGEKGAGAAARGLLDNYDDAEGYYNFQVYSEHRLIALNTVSDVLLYRKWPLSRWAR